MTPRARDRENFGVDMRGLTDKMRWIPEGAFEMGSEDFYPEERPVDVRAAILGRLAHRVSFRAFVSSSEQAERG
jgi:formylglycine-generating enzyme required for sulfatase activity